MLVLIGEGSDTGGMLVELAAPPVHHVMPAVSVMMVKTSVGMHPGGLLDCRFW